MAKKPAKRAAKKVVARPARSAKSKAAVAKPKAKPAKPAKKPAAKKALAEPSRKSTAPASDGRLTFNHAMIYVKDVNRALGFYRDLLGFKLIEDFRFDNTPVYARLRAPGGDGTIALHQASASASIASEGVRLYFEVANLDDFCHKLIKRGF